MGKARQIGRLTALGASKLKTKGMHPDFGGDAGVLAFIRPRLPPAQNLRLKNTPKLTYLEYNWTLNQQ